MTKPKPLVSDTSAKVKNNMLFKWEIFTSVVIL